MTISGLKDFASGDTTSRPELEQAFDVVAKATLAWILSSVHGADVVDIVMDPARDFGLVDGAITDLTADRMVDESDIVRAADFPLARLIQLSNGDSTNDFPKLSTSTRDKEASKRLHSGLNELAGKSRHRGWSPNVARSLLLLRLGS